MNFVLFLVHGKVIRWHEKNDVGRLKESFNQIFLEPSFLLFDLPNIDEFLKKNVKKFKK